MKAVRRALARVVLAAALGTMAAMPVQAGYGNHAERATENIQARVVTAKLYLELEAAERQAVADKLLAKQQSL
jgi:hypothetical protein